MNIAFLYLKKNHTEKFIEQHFILDEYQQEAIFIFKYR